MGFKFCFCIVRFGLVVIGDENCVGVYFEGCVYMTKEGSLLEMMIIVLVEDTISN